MVVADIDADAARSTAAEIGAAGGRAKAVAVDVADAASVERLVETTLATFGDIDVLVNNAAISAVLPRRPFWEIDDAEWARVMAVNVGGPFLCVKAAFPAMRRKGYGKIINIASGTVFKGTPGLLHYVTSKAALLGFTRVLARELGPFGIRVNTLAPGLTESDTLLQHTPAEIFAKGYQDRALARPEVPDDLVGTLIFLASPASDFVTGQTIVVDGGSVLH